MISCKDKVVFVLAIFLACEVVLFGGEVTLVNRNVTDSFRVGEDGCLNDTSVCTNHSATCQLNSGLCLCSSGSPNFRNPTIISDGSLKYGESYGCVSSINIRLAVDTTACQFSPFQVIPYNHHDPVTQFHYKTLPGETIKIQSCSLQDAWAKFPDNFTEMKLQGLNETYVNLTILNNDTHFKWRRSVPELQGTITTFNLGCTLSPQSYTNKCLRAKILGTWRAGTTSTWPTDAVSEPTLSSTKHVSSQESTSSTQSTTVVTTSKPKLTTSNKSDDSVSDSNDTNKAVYAVLAIALVMNVVLGFIVGFLCKKLKRIQDKFINIAEMQSVDKPQRKNKSDDVSPYDEVMVKGGLYNVGADHLQPSPLSGNSNTHGRLQGGYVEPPNYEPLRRNNLQDDEHRYQSLAKQDERK